MVKRRDKTGRRQILQLEDKKPPPVNKVPKKGLIHYSDSEDEKTHPKSEPSVGSSSEKNSTVDTAPIDSQLADFMKEIDALQAEEKQESSEAEPNPCVASSSNSDPVKSSSEENGVLPSVQTESKDQVSESHISDDPVVSAPVDMGMYCLWQECRDDSTGYSYYWNMQTNEVTWECPPEYLAYLQYLNSTVEPTTSQASLPKSSSSKGSRSTKKTKSKKDSISGLEGKIIPISYFGGSSSSEDSTDDSAECSDVVVSSRSKLKKKSESSVSSQSGRSKLSNKDQGKKTSKETTVSKAETIGPQLPPDFQFSEDVPVAPTTSVINSSLDGVPYVENDEEESPIIGPQLPAYYIPRENRVTEASPPPADQDCSAQEDNQLTKVSTSDEVTVNGTAEHDPPQSTVDGSAAHASSDGETWEESLLKIEQQFRNSDKVKKEEEEEPDSTTKKETAQPVQTVNSSKTNEKIVALKPVVEYSSCTDDDEEMDTSSAGPSHQSNYHVTNSNLIDSMFSFAHTSDKKFGFGFSKCQQLEMENDFEAGYSQSRGKQPKRKMKGSYSKINFVKSKEVLDLNALNKCTIPEQEEVSSAEVNNNSVEDETQPDVSAQNASPPDENPVSAVDDVDCDEIDQALESALTEKVTESMSITEKAAEPSTSEVIVEPSTSDTQIKKGKKHPADADIKPDTVVKKLKQEEPETSAETSPSLATSILDLSNILVDKLSFLVSSQSTMSSLTSLLIQMQTRLIDWQSGALDSKYFMDRLQEVDQYLHHYEMSSVTGDWMCQWDSEHKRYFYVNRRTQQSQWTFPPECSIQVAMQNKQLWENHISDIAVAASSTSSYPTAGGQFPLVSSSMSDERSHNATPSGGIYVVKEEDPEHEMLDLYPTPSASWTCPASRPQPSPPPPPPGVDSPPPPPPPVTPPPASPPPPPPAPDSTELEEGEIPDVDMDVEDSNSSGSVIYSGKASQSDDLLSVPSNMLESCSSTGSPDHHPRISTGLVSSTSAINSTIIVKPPQPVVSSSSSLVHVSGASNIPSTWTHTGPSCSSTQNSYHAIPMVADEASVMPGGASIQTVDSVTVNEVSETSMIDNGNNMPTPSVTSASSIQHPVNVASTSASTSTATASTSGSSSSSGTSSKKEKKKSKLLPGLALKRKNIPNLVEKWVKIKKQQEKENKNADEARISTSM